MGQQAEDVVDGSQCTLCGATFVHTTAEHDLFSHGYPVVCWTCWHGLTKEEKREHQRAIVPTLN